MGLRTKQRKAAAEVEDLKDALAAAQAEVTRRKTETARFVSPSSLFVTRAVTCPPRPARPIPAVYDVCSDVSLPPSPITHPRCV